MEIYVGIFLNTQIQPAQSVYYLYVIRADLYVWYQVLANQLVCSFLRKIIFSTHRIAGLRMVLCIELRDLLCFPQPPVHISMSIVVLVQVKFRKSSCW